MAGVPLKLKPSPNAGRVQEYSTRHVRSPFNGDGPSRAVSGAQPTSPSPPGIPLAPNTPAYAFLDTTTKGLPHAWHYYQMFPVEPSTGLINLGLYPANHPDLA